MKIGPALPHGERRVEAENGGTVRGATLRQLKAFSVVARHQSFVRAAAELHLTPSAVSLQIKELEQAVGLPLFGRAGRSTCLTRAGELLLVDVNRAFLALKDADDTLSRLCGKETGVVSVGMVSNATYFFPRLLANFHAAHPDIELHVSVANRDQLVRKLGNNEIDLAIMGQPPPHLNARFTLLAAQPLGIIAAPEHQLARKRSLGAADLADCEFIVRETGSGTRAAMDRFFNSIGIAPRHLMELGSNETIKQSVMANMGLAFLSLQTASLEIKNKMLVVLDVVGLPLMRSWHVVTVGPEPLSAAAESLRRYIADVGGDSITCQVEELASAS
jgi:DNA-binding transcriptional LysR family regulator